MKREILAEINTIIDELYNKNLTKEASELEDTFLRLAQDDGFMEFRDNYVEKFLQDHDVDVTFLDPNEAQEIFQRDFPEEWIKMEDRIDFMRTESV